MDPKEPMKRSGMGRFDFSKSSQRATNEDEKEFTDRHGNNIVTDKFGNRHLVRNGETKDFSYQEKYAVDLSQDESGILTANVHMDQDPVIDKIIESAEGMLRFHQGGDMKEVKGQLSGDLADYFEKQIATDEDNKDERVSNLQRLVSMGRQFKQQRGQDGVFFEEEDRPVSQPSPSHRNERANRFLDEFISHVEEEPPVTRTSSRQAPQTRSGNMRKAMLCNECNGEVSVGMRFCPNCGMNLL